jgi:homoserine dehydrogenase
MTNGNLLAQRFGVRFEVLRIAVRDLSKPRAVAAPAELFTENADDLITDPNIRIVVELMGGIQTPLAFVKKAIKAGKTVLTGNKALLAEHGQEIFHLAHESCVPVFYEAESLREHPWHIEWHEQLHTEQDDRHGNGFCPGPRRGPAARLRGG